LYWFYLYFRVGAEDASKLLPGAGAASQLCGSATLLAESE
jgi:hypothetical protein